MGVQSQLKSAAVELLRLPAVNAPLRAVLKPAWVRRRVPARLLGRLPVNSTVLIELGDGARFRMIADGHDPFASRLYWFGADRFEPETMPLFRRLVQHARSFVDIGANVGFYTLYAGALKPTLPMLAFEPVPQILAALQRNVAANQLARVSTFGCALADFRGETPFFLPRRVTLPTTATMQPGLLAETVEIQVPTDTLDDVVAHTGFGVVDLIKIDTETTEPAVLRGARRILREDEPMIVCEVLQNRTSADLHALLAPLGYEYYWISDAGLLRRESPAADPGQADENFLFITPTRKRLLLDACGAETLEECYSKA